MPENQETPAVPTEVKEEPKVETPSQQVEETSAPQKEIKAEPSVKVDNRVGDSNKGLRFDLISQREKARKFREEAEGYKAELDRLRAQVPSQESSPPAQTNNDLAALGLVDSKSVAEIVRQELRRSKTEEVQDESFDYILAQDDVGDNKQALAELSNLYREKGLDKFALTHPFEAADLALAYWRSTKSRQIDPSLKAQATGLPSGSGQMASGGKKVWTREEMSDIAGKIHTLSRDEAKKLIAEVDAAVKEGRIK